LRAELDSQGPIAESAQIQNNNTKKHADKNKEETAKSIEIV
jgi:hypothetical protein